MLIKKHYASFSDAIRAGAALRPQCQGLYFDAGRSCAFGAGAEALFGVINSDDMPAYEVMRMFPYIENAILECPAGCKEFPPANYVTTTIFHLNDDHKWSRGRIADWLHEYEDSIGYVTICESESESPQVIESQILIGPKFSMIG